MTAHAERDAIAHVGPPVEVGANAWAVLADFAGEHEPSDVALVSIHATEQGARNFATAYALDHDRETTIERHTVKP